MRKKLVLLCMMLCSIFCAFACNNDPYKDMTLVKNIGDETVQLNISEEKVAGEPVYNFDSYTFNVQVQNVKDDVDKRVTISGGEGMVTYSAEYIGNGITRITVNPISSSQTGKFTLVVKTLEGNRSLSVDFKIDLKMNGFAVNQENLQVIQKGKDLDLRDLDKFIDFDPIDTTQKDFEFSIAEIRGDGKIEGDLSEEFYYENKDALNGNYATIRDNILRTSSNPLDVYPTRTETIKYPNNVEYTVVRQYIPIKLTYTGEDAVVTDENGISQGKRFMDIFFEIEVIEDCSDVQLLMNYQRNLNDTYAGDMQTFALTPNEKGEYDVLLLDPNYRYGVFYDTYYIERDLKFSFNSNNSNMDEYRVELDSAHINTNVDSTNLPVSISGPIDNTFKVQAQKEGNYKYKFKIEHNRFPGIIDSEIIVNFRVVSLPTDLQINNTVRQNNYKIYDYYANSYGARFNVDLNGSSGFNYFVYADSMENANNFKLYKADGSEQVLGYLNDLDEVVSLKDGYSYSYFRDNETFFLRHTFENLPESDIRMYIGVEFNVGSVYDAETKYWYFENTCVSFPIDLSIENSVKEIKFTQPAGYMLDLTNRFYTDGLQNDTGVKLFDLPKGQTFSKVFGNNAFVYDHDLIDVYALYDELENVYSIYMKANADFREGSTTLSVTTRNGIYKTVNVSTFVPTIYALNGEGKLGDDSNPIGVSFEESEVLYYFTDNYQSGDVQLGDQEKRTLKLMKNDEIYDSNYSYMTLSKLILLKNSSLAVRFYDYLVYNQGDELIIVPIDITDRVRVSFNYDNYATYNSGRLNVSSITENKNYPVVMTISYNGGYTVLNDEGVAEYVTERFTWNIELYIYAPLEGVDITTPKNVDIYIENSLSYYDKDFSEHRIKSKFVPSDKKMGAEWNDSELFGRNGAVNLIYDIDEVNSRYIYLDDGSILTIRSLEGSEFRELTYGDLFEFYVPSWEELKNQDSCYCDIKCVPSKELIDWIKDYGSSDFDYYLKEVIFKENITLVINVYITQFSKLQNINSVTINAKYANKVSGFDIDVSEDGVYFEIREDKTLSDQIITYNLINADVVNKNLFVINPSNNVFKAVVNSNSTGNGGSIRITPNIYGEEYLIITPQDNISNVKDGVYSFYKDNLVQSFRVKVADGSSEFPFEIRTISDYMQMQSDLNANVYFNYVLTRNINLNEIANPQLVVNQDYKGTKTYTLNGQHIYYRNNELYIQNSVLYNYIYRGTIETDADLNIGLFSVLNMYTVLHNVTVNNAYIDISLKSLNSKIINIGILSGSASGATIENSSVTGSIIVNNQISADAVESNTINIGGMIGNANETQILGLPISYSQGINNSAYNANVLINYTSSSKFKGNTFNVGGLIGNDSRSKLSDLNVLPTIQGLNYKSAVGAVIGLSNDADISNLSVYPVINIINESSFEDLSVNISTLIGKIANVNDITNPEVTIKNVKIFFVNQASNGWISNTSVYTNTKSVVNFGGFVGNVEQVPINIEYSYIRGFYTEINDRYKGNIYIIAKDSSRIGGFVGAINNSVVTMKSSYFDADITSNAGYIGMLFGSTGFGAGSNISDCYAIGFMNTLDMSATNKLTSVKGLNGNYGLFAGVTLQEFDSSLLAWKLLNIDQGKCASISNLATLDNVYTIINENTYYFGESGKCIGLYKENGTILDIIRADTSLAIPNYLENVLGYKLLNETTNTTSSASEYTWLWNKDANMIGSIAYPMLFNEDKTAVLYDLIPEVILVDRIGENQGFYNISYTEGDETYNQILMFVNQTSSNVKKEYYDIKVNSETSSISITFNGKELISRFLKINGDIIITENSDGEVIEIIGSRIYPKGEGLATLTISSAYDKNIYLDIVFKLVNGLTNISINQNHGKDNTVYVDETDNFTIVNENIVGGIRYIAGTSYGYKLEILDASKDKTGDDTGIENAKLIINSVEYIYDATDSSKNIVFIDPSVNVNNLSVCGVTTGEFKFTLTPYVILDSNLKYDFDKYVLEHLESQKFTIVSKVRAKSIDADKESLKIASKNKTSFNLILETGNVSINSSNNINILENIYINIAGRTYTIFLADRTFENCSFANGVYTFTPTGSISHFYEINHELIMFKIKSFTVQKTNVDSQSRQNTYKIVFNFSVEFNKDYYRIHANEFDLNTLVYDFKFAPSSNEKVVYDNLQVSISPSELKDIFYNFYSRGELLVNDENESYPSENESNFVVPGRSGLLKLTLDEEFTDSSYITVTLDNSYSEYVTVSQMAGIVKDFWLDSDIDSIVESDYGVVAEYSEIMFDSPVSSSSEYGIRLTKMSLNYLNSNYFNKTYFVKLALDLDYGNLTEVRVKVTSYKATGTGVVVNYTRIITLKVTQLPRIDATIDNEHATNLGVGVKKAIDITYREITNNIEFTIVDVTNRDSGGDIEPKNIYIVDDNGDEIQSELSLDYLNAGGKYYICYECTDDNSDIGHTILLSFRVNETVMGVLEKASKDITLYLVDFEIDSITMNRAIDGAITLKHGEKYILNTNIDYTDIVVGENKAISNYIDKLTNRYSGAVSIVEMACAGTLITQTVDNNIVNINNYNRLNLSRRIYNAGNAINQNISLDVPYDYFTIKQDSLDDNGYHYNYYYLYATSITNDNELTFRLVIPYSYIEGKFVVSEWGYTDQYEVDFTVTIKDNSTYDHPNPIENQSDLYNACLSDGGDYILLNNIELEDWIPMEAKFASLDGNGYKISFKRDRAFGLSSFQGSDSAVNVGIFTTISETTLIKNVIIDVANLLVNEKELLNAISKVSISNKDTYQYNYAIDLSFTKDVNFGILAGTNNGSITNVKIVNTSSNSENIYLHVVTSQGYVDEDLMISMIGGLVGVNSNTGAITNSFVGLNMSTMGTDKTSYIECVSTPSKLYYSNEDDSLSKIDIYPFVLAGGNNLAGITADNQGGIISNTYVKAMGIYNTYPAVLDSSTGGLVATNTGNITSTFVEGLTIDNYRAIYDDFRIESKGNIGGLVYSNDGIIENSYTNVYLETQSAFTGGFVYINQTNGQIKNSYSTAINKRNIAHGQFTGVSTNGVDVQNFGTFYNCYYLVMTNEIENNYESATAIKLKEFDIGSTTTWGGFSFTASKSNGIWVISENNCPKLAQSLIDTVSFRVLENIEKINEGESNYERYDYSYRTYNLGSEKNPLIIDQAEYFSRYIIDNGSVVKVDGTNRLVVGAGSTGNSVLSINNDFRYVRLVNNLDFENITSASTHDGHYLYNTIFAGVLDGNGMTLDNLNIVVTDDPDISLQDFGLFAQIGLDSSNEAVIKNLNINVRTFKSNDSNRAGILAGTIKNASIINVKIDGGYSQYANLTIGARNMAGALAGLIYADDSGSVSLYDIIIQNIAVEANYSSLAGELTAESEDKSNGFYNKFSVRNLENVETTVTSEFKTLYNLGTKSTDLYNKKVIRTDVSYAGLVAGILIANNTSQAIDNGNNFDKYRSKSACSVDNITVKDAFAIRTADNAGGLFGYLSETTRIKNSRVIVGENQILKGNNFIGGLVGENHGIIEKSYVSYAEDIESKFDATILDNNRASSNISIFDSTDYTVAIGGIAGYSANGVIIDTYMKANVFKNLAYIAGGIIGYSENYNYIGYSYTIGTVYAKFITGGLVGIRVGTSKENLTMYQVYGLTDWHYSNENLNVTQNITKILYDSQKVLYANGGGYHNFYVKMPEIGNLDIETTGENAYKDNHNNYYVGSAIGFAIRNNGSYSSSVDGYNNLIQLKEKDADGNDYKEEYQFNNSEYIYTNTLGLYSTTGSLSAGDKVDSYDNTTFTFSYDLNTNVVLHSYRISYNPEDLSLNHYEKISISEENATFDVFSYPQIYVQEYTQQILGAYSYHDKATASSVTTKNLFRYDYNSSSRHGTITHSNSFVSSNSETAWTMDTYLPKFSNGLISTNKTITNSEELKESLTTISSGILFEVKPSSDNYTIEYNVGDVTSSTVLNIVAISDFYRGVIDGSKENPKPTINFDIAGDAEVDGGLATINTIFNLMSGASFENIKFVFNFKNISMGKAKEYSRQGFIANSLQNVNLVNCDFEINLPDLKFEDNASGDIKQNNIGLLFGEISNSILRNNTFTLTINSIEISNDNIQNFGLIAGNIYGSTIENNEFSITFTNKEINLNNYADNLNFGLVAGAITYSTYSENSLTISDLVVNDNQTNNVSFGLFSFANNSNIKAIIVNSAIKYNINEKKDKANISLLVGESVSTIIDNVTLKNDLEIVANTNENTDINVGGFIANNTSGSRISNSRTQASIKAEANAHNLSVGGFVGLSASSSQLITSCVSDNAKIEVVNTYEGVVNTEDKKVKVEIYALTGIGEMVGKTIGVTQIKNVVAGGNITAKLPTNAPAVRVGIGGIVGLNTVNLSIQTFTVVTDYVVTSMISADTNEFNDLHVSGVIGLNNGTATLNDGFIYIEVPINNGIEAYNVTNNSISINSKNVYYAQEFVRNNYTSDIKFISFAMADIYDSICEYSKVNYFNTNSKFSLKKFDNANIIIPIPSTVNYSKTLDGNNNRFKVYDLSIEPDKVISVASGNNLPNKYNVINSDNLSMDIHTLGAGYTISGRSTETGKVIVSVSGDVGGTTLSHAININNGIVSNIYLNITTTESDGKKIALVSENNGLITDVFVYGYTTAQYAIADTNNGKILKCASSTIYKGGQNDQNSEQNTIYGLVKVNGVTGIISDCYSTNFGYTASSNVITNVYGLVQQNNGTIEYCNYYIPEVMLYDNKIIGVYDREISTGKSSNISTDMTPSFINSRSNVWTVEGVAVEKTQHSQIVGFKDIAGAIEIRVKLTGGKSVESTFVEIKDTLTNKTDTNKYSIDYEVHFYVPEKSRIGYNVVRIVSGTQFVNYINSLDNKIIPANTIVIIMKDITINSQISFSLSSSAMLCGMPVEKGGVTRNATITTSSSLILNDVFVKDNRGIIACLKFDKIKFVNKDISWNYFAPIRNNFGVIYDLSIDHITVDGGSRAEYVAGIVGYSAKDALISRCYITNLELHSNKYWNIIVYSIPDKTNVVNTDSGSLFLDGQYNPYGY